MTLIGVGAIVVAAVVLGSVALPVVADQWSDNRDEGKDLAAATGATMRQASDVSNSFGSLIPARAEAAAEEDDDDLTQAGPESPDASNDRVGSGHDVQHAVAAALEALASLDTGKNDVSANARIVAIENLREIWSPRYLRAEEEHRRLALRVEHAERAAELYFSAQSELTGYINSPEERSRAERSDLAERAVYRRWRDQAYRTLGRADLLMSELHDLDVLIAKGLLSANFASVYRDFLELPLAIRDLHRDLQQFRAQSEEIGAAFAGN